MKFSRNERGQGSLEHLGAIVLAVTFILGTISAVTIYNPQIGENIAYQVCKVVQKAGGGECTPPDPPPTPEERIPDAPCVVDSDAYNGKVKAAVVVSVEKGLVYIVEELSDGTFRVTAIDKEAAGFAVGPGFDVSATVDGKKYGISGNVSAEALLAANKGETWNVDSRDDVDDIINGAVRDDVADNTVGNVPVIGGLLSSGVKKVTGESPEPDETFHEGGLEVRGEAVVSNILFQGQANVSGGAYVGYKERDDGYTAYFSGKVQASFSMGGVWGPSEDPAAMAEFVYEVNFDKNGKPTSVTMRTATQADSSGYDEDDTREVTEHVYTIPIENEGDEASYEEIMKNPFTFAEEAKRDGTYSRNTYDVNDSQYGAIVTGKLIGEYGGGFEGGHTAKDLTKAEYWDGTAMVDRPDCEV